MARGDARGKSRLGWERRRKVGLQGHVSIGGVKAKRRPQGQQVKMTVWICPDRRARRVPRQLVSPQSLGPGPVQSRRQVSRTCRVLPWSCANCRESSPANICSTQHGKAEDGRGPRGRGPGDLVLHRAADAYTPGRDAAAIMLEIVRACVHHCRTILHVRTN